MQAGIQRMIQIKNAFTLPFGRIALRPPGGKRKKTEPGC